MAITYCNTTSDLTNVYRDIDRNKGYFTLDSTKWVVHSGSTYKQLETGQINMIFENGVAFTLVANAAAVDGAGEWFYDSTLDTVYIYCTAGANPNTKTIESGETWGTFKTTCRNDAQELLEGYLRKVFIVPFRKIVAPAESYNSKSYDYWIVRACALLTCAVMIKRLDPISKVADELWKEVYNPLPLPEETKGIVQQILDGDVELKIQRSTREPGSFNVYEYASNAATAFFNLSGNYTGHLFRRYRLQIDTAGTPGTATYKLSNDGGSSFDITKEPTLTSGSEQDKRKYIVDGIFCEFIGTFTTTDYIDLECFPVSDVPTRSQFNTVTLER